MTPMVTALRSLFDDGQLVRLWGVPVEEVARRIEGAYLAERGKEEAFGPETAVPIDARTAITAILMEVEGSRPRGRYLGGSEAAADLADDIVVALAARGWRVTREPERIKVSPPWDEFAAALREQTGLLRQIRDR